jgi:hypothetical protein
MSLISGLTGKVVAPTKPPTPPALVKVETEMGTRMVRQEDVKDGYIETAKGGIPIESGGQDITTTLPATVIHPGAGGGTTIPVDFDGPFNIGPGSGGDGDGGGTPSGVSWSEFDSGLAGPDWWKALKPSEVTKETEQLANLNLLIPLLSPEDQRQVAQALYNADPKNFAHLNPEDKDFFPPPGVGRGIREKFQDVSRAESGLAALTKLAEATGTKEEKQGSGTRFLRNILDQMQDFSGGGQQTRQQFTEMMGSVDPTIKGVSSEQKPFQSLARMLSQPFFSTGSLMNVSRRQDGQYVFGKENRGLFF